MTEVVDDINLRYDIMHRDIAARNFLIAPQTQKLLLFDFNNTMQIGDPSKNPKFNGPSDVEGVIFTIHELLPLDKSFKKGKAYWQHEVGPIESMAEWPIKATLELGLDVASIRLQLDHWGAERRTLNCITHFAEATYPIIIPKVPEETDKYEHFATKTGNGGLSALRIMQD